MSHRPSVFGRFWRNIKHTLTVTRTKEICVGMDVNGNKFYERPAEPEKNIKLQRRIESADGDQWNAPEVPVEWMSWLQNKRANPPTPEEIERNYIQMLRIQRRAAELEDNIKDQPRDGRENMPSEPKQTGTFPKYEEFETEPGEFSNNRRR